MKLNVKDLRDFKQNSSQIKKNTILPILSYLKFDKGKVTKNSLSSFVIQEIHCDETFLVDETVLFAFINNTTATEIDIKISDKKITISDKNSTVYSPTDDVLNFPTNATPEGEKHSLDNSVISAIYTALNFLEEDSVPSMKNHVFIGLGKVFGSGTLIGYSEPCDKKLPKISIKKETAVAISKLSDVEFSENDTYHFFSSGYCRYGFIKSEYPFHDLTPIFKTPEGLKFTIDKTDFIKENNMVMEMSKSPVSIISIEPVKGKLKYKTDDAAYGTGASREFDIVGDDDVDFKFNPALMNRLLKNCPDDKLTFHKQKGGHYFVTGDSDFVALIAGMQ